MFVQETFCYHICQLPVGFHWLPDRLQRDGTLFPWPPRHLQGTDWEVNRSRRSFWMCTLVVTQQAPTRTCNILQPKTRSHNTWVISNKVMVQRSCALQITLTFLSVLYGLAIVNLARGLSFEESADGLHTTEIHWEIVSKQSSRGPSRTSTRMWLRLGLQDVRKESTLVWHRRRGHRRTSCTSGRSLPLTPSPEPRTVWERSSKMRRLQSSCNVIPPRSRWDNGVLAYMATDDMSCHVMTWHDSSWNLIIFWMTQTQLFGIYLCPSIFTPVPLHWMSSFVNHGQNPQELERKAKETKDLDEWHKNCGKGVWKDRSWNLWHLYGQAWTSKTFIQFFMIRTEVPRVINNLIWMHSFFPAKCWSMPWVWGTCRLNSECATHQQQRVESRQQLSETDFMLILFVFNTWRQDLKLQQQRFPHLEKNKVGFLRFRGLFSCNIAFYSVIICVIRMRK